MIAAYDKRNAIRELADHVLGGSINANKAAQNELMQEIVESSNVGDAKDVTAKACGKAHCGLRRTEDHLIVKDSMNVLRALRYQFRRPGSGIAGVACFGSGVNLWGAAGLVCKLWECWSAGCSSRPRWCCLRRQLFMPSVWNGLLANKCSKRRLSSGRDKLC